MRNRFTSIVVALAACSPEPLRDETEAPRPAAGESDEVDVIVVGSGAGGGPLAARLARAGKRVLLLEAGSDVGGRLHYRVPALHARSTEDRHMAWWYFVDHHAGDELDASDSKWTEEGILYPRGSALGGSTAVNALVTVLPSPTDWDRLASSTGDRGWRARDMAPYFARVREWLSIELPDPALAGEDETVLAFLAAAAAEHAEGDEAATFAQLGNLAQQDLNEALAIGEPAGLYRLPLATEGGRRAGTREWLLQTVDEGHPLAIRTEALVTRVLWEDGADPPRAIGVEVVPGRHLYGARLPDAEPEPRGEAERLFAREEVVLAAGAFNTPQLLQLSGVGDPDRLEPLGIETVVASPNVGRRLQDRYEVSVVFESDEPLAILADCALEGDLDDDPCVDDWRAGHGVYETTGFLATVLRRSEPDLPLANLQIFATPGDARGYYPGYSRDAVREKTRFSWIVLEAHTRNRDGTVRLRSADPLEPPDVRFRYFDEDGPEGDPDLRALVEGVRFVRRLAARLDETLGAGAVREIWPGPAVRTDEDIARWARREAWGHHACCTAPLGDRDDHDAVLDDRFRVVGAESLRVVDASVFPEIPGTFLALPLMMASERAADLLLEDRP